VTEAERTTTDTLVNRFCEIYANLNSNNIETLAEVYAPIIEFSDPMHTLRGIDAVYDYMRQMYQNVEDYSVTISDKAISNNIAFVSWTIEFTHPKLNSGNIISVSGCTKLTCSNKIIKHEDFFDASTMLFEHIPLLGSAIRFVKGCLV